MPIHKNIQANYRNHLLSSLFCFCLLLGFWYFSSFEIFFFPTEISPNQPDRHLQADSTYASFKEITVHYTGYCFEKGGKVRGCYYYSLIDNECFFFLLKNATCNGGQETLTLKELRGAVVTNGSITELLLDNLAADLDWDREQLAKIANPCLIDEIHYYFVPHMVVYGLLFFLTLLLFLNMCLSMLYIAYPALSPACGGSLLRPKLSFRYLMLAEKELEQHCLVKGNDFFITRHFIIELTNAYTHILPLKRLAMVYEQHGIYPHFGFGRRMRYTITYHYKKRKHAVRSVYHRRTDVDTILGYLRDYYPEIINEHYSENKDLLKEL